MFSHDNYTVFMITMRIGKQGIPLWFRCFKDKNDSNAFSEQLLMDGISYVSNLFDDSFHLIFLADRWFNSTTLMDFINSLGHTYCIRLKGNIKVLIYDHYKRRKIWKNVGDINAKTYIGKSFNDILLTDKSYKTNMVISKKDGVKDPWIIVTNGDITIKNAIVIMRFMYDSKNINVIPWNNRYIIALAIPVVNDTLVIACSKNVSTKSQFCPFPNPFDKTLINALFMLTVNIIMY